MTSGVRKNRYGFDDFQREMKAVRREIKEHKETLLKVAAPYMREHADRMLETAGRPAGANWNFRNEPKYRTRKAAIHGERFARKPLVVPRGIEELRPSLVERSSGAHIARVENGALVLGSRLEYADRLLARGGRNPFDERYPGRNPYELGPEQEKELEDKIRAHKLKRMRAKVKAGKIIE